MHIGVLSMLCAVYWLHTRQLPEARRVHPLWFLAVVVVMPVTYVLYTPLALFTLDSSSWETRVAQPSKSLAPPASPSGTPT
jgi:hypothetical protein